MTLRPIFILATILLLALCVIPHTAAEGSISLFPSGATGNRANLEWRTSSYGGGLLKRRTLLRVYANQGEYLLVGSSAVGVSGNGGHSGDIVIYRPEEITQSPGSPVGQETIPAYNAGTDFEASSQSGRGVITSRAQEVAGANSVTGNVNPNGYTPAYYVAPETGAYWIVFTGPNGSSDDTNGTVLGAIDIGTSTDGNATNNFGSGQQSSVTAWDVTVRPGAASGPSGDETGRLFCSDLAMFVGSNGRNLYSSLYAVTTDGYQYTVALNGVDPNGFIIYGSKTGLLDSDGVSPLYHDVLAATNAVNQDQLTSIQGGCTLSIPQYPLFFQPQTDSIILSAAGVMSSPVTPRISALSFTGTPGNGTTGSNSRIGTGGTFSFTSNIDAVYDITIVGSSGNPDPTLPTNRRLRGLKPSGANTVTWDGKDNSGNLFPVGTGYTVNAIIHGGEYHFPLLDAENSPRGGPSFTLTNPPGGTSHPLSATFGFYDDRGYITLNGTTIGTPGTVLAGNGPPGVAASSTTAGYDTTSAQRAYGNGGSTGFGDKKGLDLWTYYPSDPASATLNVQGAPHILLVKRITALNGVDQTGFSDDPGTTDDNSPYWPSPASTYLRGVRSIPAVKPGDELEYTIYFVDTNGPGSNLTLADVLPAGMAFEATAYGAVSGIALASSASSVPTSPTSFLTNAADSDQGTYDAPGTQAPAAANPPTFSGPLPAASNTNGVVTLVLPSLPAATGAGTPAGSYGFVRFRVRVQ